MTEDRLPLAELLQKAGDGDFLRAVAEAVLQLLMESDVEGLIGAGRHERSAERLNYRNGYRERALDTRLGTLQLRVPKLRQGSYFPPFLEPRKVSERALVAVIQEAWIGGVSTRRSTRSCRRWAWRDRQEHGLQAVQGDRRARERLPRPAAGGRVALPVAGRDLPEGARGRPDRLGGRHSRGRGGHGGPARDRRPGPRPLGGGELLVGLPQGPAQAWPARRQARGLGRHEGLKHAIAKVLGATWQRCRVHWMRNALAHVPEGQQSVVAAALRQAFLQADQDAARQVWRQLADQLRPRWPKLSALMDDSEHEPALRLDRGALAYIGFPVQHRAKLHSTDVLDKSLPAAVLWWPGTGDRVALSGAAAASPAGSPHPDDPAAVAAPVRLLPGFWRHCATRCS
jgi:hypothetical protein